MNMDFRRKLPIPMEIKEQYPLPTEASKLKAERDDELKRCFSGKSDKLVLIIGPCSADNETAVLEYLSRLRSVQERVADSILIIPRVFTNKPRTNGAGYKGMLHQPDPTTKPDMLKGLIACRELHIRAICESGFGCADELLYPANHRYFSDLLSYVTIGARSVENQEHRLVASGLDIPVGMKNPLGGSIGSMLNSIYAAQHGHTFIYRGWEVVSSGNPYAHAILRGLVGADGRDRPNYCSESLALIASAYGERELSNPAVIVDCNHSNSGKRALEQPRIAKEILRIRQSSGSIKKMLRGLMIESYLEDGVCLPESPRYGCSITDPCIGWEKTERLIYDIAEML